MTIDFVLPAFTGLLWAIIGVIFSQAARRGWDFLSIMTLTSLFTFIAACIIFPRYGSIGEQSGMVMLIAVLGIAGIFQAAGMLLMQGAMRTGHHAVAWTLSQSAMVVPFIAGFVLWQDRLMVSKWMGLALILTAVILFAITGKRGGGQAGGRSLVLALVAFTCIGIQQTLVGVPSRWPGWTDAAGIRVPLISLGSMVSFLFLCLIRRKLIVRPPLKTALLMFLFGLPGHYFIFRGLDAWAKLDMAGVVYPMAIGVCVTAFACYSIFYLREKSSPLHYAGILAGIAGIAIMAI